MAGDLFSSPLPFIPPTTEEDRLAWLRLIRSRRVGPTTFWRMLAEYPTAKAALAALPEVARAAGVRDYAACPADVAAAEIDRGRGVGARLVCAGAAGYPAALLDLPDAPPLFWALGDTALTERPTVALVGARNASSLGTRMARKLGAGLAEAGFAVVSGLARGIDAAAHQAALMAARPGGTIAVQAGGVDIVYPAENAALAEEIGARGLRLSEHPPGLQPQARHFPLRNRLVSGLARAVVVVEAAARSGSLITARCALDQGREVLAVPGHPLDARAAGCNQLIRDGATLVRGIDDVLEAIGLADEAGRGVTARASAPRTADGAAPGRPPAAPAASALPPKSSPPAPRPLRDIAALHGQILDRLGPSPLAEDQLIRDLAMPAAAVAPELLTLELEGRILRQPGGLLSRLN